MSLLKHFMIRLYLNSDLTLDLLGLCCSIFLFCTFLLGFLVTWKNSCGPSEASFIQCSSRAFLWIYISLEQILQFSCIYSLGELLKEKKTVDSVVADIYNSLGFGRIFYAHIDNWNWVKFILGFIIIVIKWLGEVGVWTRGVIIW